MSVSKQNVSMPMGSAGIIGFSSDMKISGQEVEPKVLVIIAVVLVLVVKVVGSLVTA